jgi:arylsulfatase A-like enzyme
LAKSVGGFEALKLLFAREEYDAFNTKDAAGEEIRWWTEEMGAEKLNARALKWATTHTGQPCFLYLHYIDVHGPHNPPRPFAGNACTEAQRTIDLYDGDLRYVDSQINSFLEDLEKIGIRDNSIIIITSDHGHDFGDHGGWNHGRDLYEEQIEIPMVFLRTSAFPHTATIREAVGLVDLLPTLLDYLGIRTSTVQMDGKSFAAAFHTGSWPDAPQYRYHETDLNILHRSVRYQNRWKLIRSMPGGVPREQLFDLSNDPKETSNVLEKQPLIAAELRKRLDEEFAEFQRRTYSASVAEPDERTRQLLKSLGYLD